MNRIREESFVIVIWLIEASVCNTKTVQSSCRINLAKNNTAYDYSQNNVLDTYHLFFFIKKFLNTICLDDCVSKLNIVLCTGWLGSRAATCTNSIYTVVDCYLCRTCPIFLKHCIRISDWAVSAVFVSVIVRIS